MAYLDGAFLSKQGIGLEKYKHVTKHKFLAELDVSSQYNILTIHQALDFQGVSKMV
jgi:hypothetical protein